jgi:hypothetical protein
MGLFILVALAEGDCPSAGKGGRDFVTYKDGPLVLGWT